MVLCRVYTLLFLWIYFVDVMSIHDPHPKVKGKHHKLLPLDNFIEILLEEK